MNLLGVIDKNAYDINLLVIFADRVGYDKILDVNVVGMYRVNKALFLLQEDSMWGDTSMRRLYIGH